VVAPIQSTRKEIFRQNAEQFGFGETNFSENISANKQIYSDILCEVLEYKFKKEDVHKFWS